MFVMVYFYSNVLESVLVYIVIVKYYDYLFLYRQLDIFECEGIYLSFFIVSNWMMVVVQCLELIYNEFCELVKDSYYVMVDEIFYFVFESDWFGVFYCGYMWNFYLFWFYIFFFEYYKGCGSSGIDILLVGQVWVVQSDGFVVYDKFDMLFGKLYLCCWVYVRCNFVEVEGNDFFRVRYVFGKIGGLYVVEEKIRMEYLEGEVVVKFCWEKLYFIIKELEKWCKEEYGYMVDKLFIVKVMFYMYICFE